MLPVRKYRISGPVFDAGTRQRGDWKAVRLPMGWYTQRAGQPVCCATRIMSCTAGGSNVRYSVDSIYDINLEMIIFPTPNCSIFWVCSISADKISEHLIAQISAELWQEALLACELVVPPGWGSW